MIVKQDYGQLIAVSHIGMIIHSTTLDTEDKVKQIYGGTTWIQHSGYMLRGATSGVVANSASKTGGADTHTLTNAQLPSLSGRTVIMPGVPHDGSGYFSSTSGIFTSSSGGSGTFRSSGVCTVSSGDKPGQVLDINIGGGQAHNNLPQYKSVYIWERTA